MASAMLMNRFANKVRRIGSGEESGCDMAFGRSV
jgi:hypothetical protein